MFRIGDFSKIARVTIKALRYYDKIGLLKPAFIDVSTGYRYYTEDQISEIYAIRLYQNAGMTNAEIKQFLAKNGMQKELLLQCKDKLQTEIEKISRQISHIDSLLSRADGETYQVSLKTVPSCRVCSFCGYVSGISQIPSFIRSCHQEIKKTNPDLRFPEPDYCCIIYPHDEYRENNVFVEYAQSVEEIGVETEIVKFKNLEAVDVISVVHRGNYDLLSDAYLYAVQWAKKHGYALRGDVRERYIHGAWDRANEGDWETEVQLPVEKEQGE